MPGRGDPVVALSGPAAELVRAATSLDGLDFALVGGLVVMVRLGGAHRVTQDLDGVFDNADEDTAASLVTSGLAEPADGSGVVVAGMKLDVIDTQPIPPEVDTLVPDPSGKLFVCAHRFAYESAQPVRLVAPGRRATIRVATPGALVACKAHALRLARAGPQGNQAPRRSLRPVPQRPMKLRSSTP